MKRFILSLLFVVFTLSSYTQNRSFNVKEQLANCDASLEVGVMRVGCGYVYDNEFRFGIGGSMSIGGVYADLILGVETDESISKYYCFHFGYKVPINYYYSITPIIGQRCIRHPFHHIEELDYGIKNEFNFKLNEHLNKSPRFRVGVTLTSHAIYGNLGIGWYF